MVIIMRFPKLFSDADTVLTAIFDKDLKVRTYKKFPIGDKGKRIQIHQGGTGHFKPLIDTNTFLDFPRKGRFQRWKTYWTRVYFVRNGAKGCVNFSTGEVPLPDAEQVKNSIGSTLLDRIGQTEQPFPSWIIWANTLINIVILLHVLGVIR